MTAASNPNARLGHCLRTNSDTLGVPIIANDISSSDSKENDDSTSQADIKSDFNIKSDVNDEGIPTESTKEQIWTARLQIFAVCYCLFLAGWNDGTNGPLIPRMQDFYHVRIHFTAESPL